MIENKKKTLFPTNKQRRTRQQVNNAIIESLKLSDAVLSTSDVARLTKCSHATASKRLRFLEFDGRVEKLPCGFGGKWKYWRIKR